MPVHSIFDQILQKIYPVISTDEIKAIRAEAVAWEHNTNEHPVPNAIVVRLCSEILAMRGEL